MNPDERETFRSYIAARSPALLRTAYLLTGNRADAEDLLQVALAKTYLAWGNIRDKNVLDGYVRRVMVNTRTSWWRRHRQVTEFATDAVPETANPREATDDVVLHDALWRALAGLGKRQRAVVVLRYYEDLTEAETAHALDISVGTVKSTTARALAKLRNDAGLRDDPRASIPAYGVSS